MVYLMHCLTNSLFFDIPLLYYYTSLNSSIICCLFSGDIYLSFGAPDSSLTSLFCESHFDEDFLETLVILSAIVLPIKSLVASDVFQIALFEAVFISSFVTFLHCQEVFDHIYFLSVLPMLFAKDKKPYPFTYILSLGLIGYLIFIMTVLFNYSS